MKRFIRSRTLFWWVIEIILIFTTVIAIRMMYDNNNVWLAIIMILLSIPITVFQDKYFTYKDNKKEAMKSGEKIE